MPLVGSANVQEVPLGDDLKEWRHTKKPMPALLPPEVAEKHLGHTSTALQDSILLHQTQISLHKAFITSPVNAKAIGFVSNPPGVCSLKAFAEGALVLKPYGTLCQAKDQEKAKFLVGNFVISPPKIVSAFD